MNESRPRAVLSIFFVDFFSLMQKRSHPNPEEHVPKVLVRGRGSVLSPYYTCGNTSHTIFRVCFPPKPSYCCRTAPPFRAHLTWRRVYSAVSSPFRANRRRVWGRTTQIISMSPPKAGLPAVQKVLHGLSLGKLRVSSL